MPRRSAATATARYIAPVSMYRNPSRRATSRATVLFPDPIGPSIAIAIASRLCVTASRIRGGHGALLRLLRSID